MKDFLRRMLEDLEHLRRNVQARLFALELADDVEYREESERLSKSLGAGHKPAFVSRDEFAGRYGLVGGAPAAE